MAQTVIGFFKDASDAQKAVEQLEGKGISRQYVEVSTGEHLDATADADGRNTNKFTDIFNKLFGHDSDDAKRYSSIGQKNVTLVTVHAASNELAEKAADILDDCGAEDVDEHGSGTGINTNSDRTSGTSEPSTNADSSMAGSLEDSTLAGTGNARRRSQIINRSLNDDLSL